MIPYSTQLIDEDDIAAVSLALRSSHLTQGPAVEAFEEALCDYLGVKEVVAMNSATSALYAAYVACGIQEGDAIITTPISFVATANMFVALGATPIWCDVRLDGNIDETKIESLITNKTKAIVAVDFGGKPVAHAKISTIAKRHNLLYIDDASHALGASVDGVKVGNFADATIFSFHAIKPITTGEGGAIATNNPEIAQKARLIRSHGITKKEGYSFDMSLMGFNFRLSDFAAALGASQLKKLDHFLAKREEIANFYNERFAHAKSFFFPKIEPHTKSARHLYPIILNPELHCKKEDIFKELLACGIGAQVHYKPIYQNSYYKERFGDARCEVANDFYKSELSIPCHQKMSLEDAILVAQKLLEILQNYSYRSCSF